jgi:predicted metal-dependent phosphoesterase TrpH
MKMLFHCHTDASDCSNITQEALLDYLNKNNFEAVAVTDHNGITRLSWPEGLVIPSAEIATSQGDIIGLFLEKEIPTGMSIKETSKQIHSQGGLVVAAHPCDTLRGEAMGAKVLIENIGCFDIIETKNSRNVFNTANEEAGKIAAKYEIPAISGSDAHTLGELKNSYIDLKTFSKGMELLSVLQSSQDYFQPSGLIPHLKTFFIKRTSRLRKHQL